jgi:glyoxylase-like metal-dependent hydrolase (beta-lactamase superfamily II)
MLSPESLDQLCARVVADGRQTSPLGPLPRAGTSSAGDTRACAGDVHAVANHGRRDAEARGRVSLGSPAANDPKGCIIGDQRRPSKLLRLVLDVLIPITKGHTPGQIALLDARDGTLICGDAYSTLGGVETAARTNPRFPLLARATWHRPTALETARALRALDPARLALAHGKVVEAPGTAMAAAIAQAS